MKKVIELLVFILLINIPVFSQIVTKSFNGTVTGAVCPEIGTQYEVSRPTGFAGCQITWTPTNGSVQSQSGNTVIIKWNDTPGAKAKLKATFSNCGSGNEGNNGKTSNEFEELILSVKGQNFSPFTNSVSVNFCAPQPVALIVPEMIVSGTGGIGQPQRLEVAYVWTLPPGWKEFNSNNTGEVITASRDITIVPTACAEPGVISVKGTIRGPAGFCMSSALSNSANISINSSPPIVTLLPQAGFTGTTACNATPVTFTAVVTNNPGCAITSYQWILPPSWSLVSQSGITASLRPSGNATDASAIKVKVTFGCGSTREPIFTPAFNVPVINGSFNVCTGGTNFTLTNAGGNSVNWAPSSTMVVNTGQGTATANIKAANSTTREVGVIGASFPACPSVFISPKAVWVGNPYEFLVEGPTLVTTGSYHYYNVKKWGTPPNSTYPSFSEQGVNSNGFTWSFDWPATSTGWDCSNCSGEYITIQAGSQSTYVTAHVQNACGTTTRNYEVFVQQENCPPGGCEEPFIVYPNPSSSELAISIPSVSSKSLLTKVTVVDSNGSAVYTRTVERNTNTVRIPVKDLKEGIYYLSLIQGRTVKKQQIIIQH